jgi:hypothetical protein
MTAKRPGYRFTASSGVIVAVALPGRGHDDDAIDAGLVHHRHELLDGERLGQLGHTARHPGAVGGFRLPDMHLRVDDHSASLRLGGRRLRTARLAAGGIATGVGAKLPALQPLDRSPD